MFQAKLAIERLNVEKEYHPFISGPRNELVQSVEKVCYAQIFCNCMHTVAAEFISVELC